MLSANSFARPYVSPDKAPLKRYYAVVPASEIPQEWSNWLGVNARDYSEKGRVPKAIRSTLIDNPGWFSEYNRGITLVVHDLKWDNKANLLTLQFEDNNYHGVLDGGHTLNAILDTRDNDDEQTSFCNLEIFTGLDKAEIPNVVEARNTSKQVASQSLLNLAGSFEPLKEALGAKADPISWRENEEGVFDVREVIGILTALDATSYSANNHPITAYSGKEACLKRFREREADYMRLFPIASDALEIWDQIQYQLPNQYNVKGPEPGTSGKFGRLSGVKTLKGKPKSLPFIGKTTQYDIPSGYIYPILSSFRAMLEEEKGKWKWGKGIDPVQLVKDGIAADIFISSVRESINNYRNPNRTGKDTQAWTSAYQAARIIYLETV
jgi:hypothetical protein